MARGAWGRGIGASGRNVLVMVLLLAAAAGVAGCSADAFHPAIKVALEQARQAVTAHDGPGAIAAIDRARSLWLARNVPFTTGFGQSYATAPRNMGLARQLVSTGRWSDAGYYLDTVLADPSILTPG